MTDPRSDTFDRREADWRCGALVYQVLVDRFAPSADLEAKRALYAPPRRLRAWDEAPQPGRYLDELGLWSHELDFWGGDLASTAARLDHLQQLGATVLYLNPIVHARTNHKYDALDHHEVAPEYGTREDLLALIAQVHRRGLRLVLDGAFNHVGRASARFARALADDSAAERDGFVFGPQYPGGARCWQDAQNLPELNLEHAPVREQLWAGPDAVLRRWLRDGSDGVRLDVAFELGPRWLAEITRTAHETKPGSLVLGEIPNYPGAWLHAVDGVLHFALRELTLSLARGELDGPGWQRMVARLIADAPYEALLRSWICLDNHDTPRLATQLPDVAARRLAQVLQFTLPGSVNLYYGSEVAMEGGDDPCMRAPMRWERVAAGHPDLAWTRRLGTLRRERRALRVGDFRTAEASGNVVAFLRHTDRAADTVLVLANPSPRSVATQVLVTDPWVMDGELEDALDGTRLRCRGAIVRATLAPHAARVLLPCLATAGGYSSYKRVR